MTVVAEFEVSTPLLRVATTAVPDMTLGGEAVFTRAGRNPKYLFWARGGSFDAFETALGRDPTIAEYAVLTTISDSQYYRVTFSDEGARYVSYDAALAHDIVFLDTEIRDGTGLVRARAPSRSTFRSYCRFYENRDVSFELVRLYKEESVGTTETEVTDKQREALRLAYERGYYDSPRDAALEALAADLDISRQAFADRLKRGTKKLIELVIL